MDYRRPARGHCEAGTQQVAEHRMVPIRRAARAGTAVSTAAKKHSLKIESTKTEAGDRVYRLCGAPHNE
jgi:hypothetical protein